MTIKLAWVPLVVCVAVSGAMARTVEFDDWQCGSEEFSRRSAHDVVVRDCPLLAAEVNHCCAVHDECYVRQYGQEKCDNDFCECNRRVLNRTEGATCLPWAETACFLMPFFGVLAYDGSVNYTEPADLVKRTPHNVELKVQYETLYASCPKVNATLSSCAVVYNHCVNSASDCSSQLCNCIRDAHALDHEVTCERATADFCIRVNFVANRSFLHYYFGDSVYFLAAVIGFVFVLFAAKLTIYCWRRHVSLMEVKYDMVDA